MYIKNRPSQYEIFFSFLVILILFISPAIHAAPSCKAQFATTRFEKALIGENTDSYQLLIEMENVYNRQKYRRDVQEVEITTVNIKENELAIHYFGSPIERQTFEPFLQVAKGKRLWFQHPFNTDSGSVPYFRDPVSKILKGYLSASRSIFFSSGQDFYSIRLPTDHARGPHEIDEIRKTEIAPEIKIAKINMHQINSVEERFGLSQKLIIAKEIVIAETLPLSGARAKEFINSGYMIRNLDFLKNKDRFYIPAFAIETVGKEIAKKFGKTFADFWIKNYAEALGRAKAQLLIHYGLQMEFPHGQNILLEFDKEFRPTGRFVLRDIDDMSQFQSVIEPMNEILQANELKPIGMSQQNSDNIVRLLWSRMSARAISWSLDPVVEKLDVTESWNGIHTQAFIQEIARLLEIKRKDIGSSEVEVSILLRSQWGQQLLKDYFTRQLKK